MNRSLATGALAVALAASISTIIVAQPRTHDLKLLPQNVHW